jgi:hypothetical protein
MKEKLGKEYLKWRERMEWEEEGIVGRMLKDRMKLS